MPMNPALSSVGLFRFTNGKVAGPLNRRVAPSPVPCVPTARSRLSL